MDEKIGKEQERVFKIEDRGLLMREIVFREFERWK